MRATVGEIEQALRDALHPQALEVLDDGHLHVGHAGAREGGHYTVRITAAAFTGLPRLARHRLVYDALSLVMPRGIHALAILARAPDEALSSPIHPVSH